MTQRLDRSSVLMALRDGYGVEDIAVLAGVPASTVRDIAAALRRDGILANIKQGRCDRANSTRKAISHAQ